MTDGQFLLLIFALLYLYECLRWVPGRAIVWRLFGRATAPGAWSRVAPLELFRTRGGAFVLLSPLPPVGAHLVTAAWPAVPHAQGLCLWDEVNGSASHIPWSEVNASAEEATLRVAPGRAVRCVHGWQAAEWARLIQSWKPLPQEERESQFLAKAATMLEEQLLRDAGVEVARATRSLRWNGTLLVLWALGILPYTYWRFGDTFPTLVAIGSLYFVMLCQAVTLWWISRRDPRLKYGRWSHILGAAFYPPSSIRAADWVCAMKSPEVHPLLAAFTLGQREAAEKLASHAWRHARWPVGSISERPWDGPEVQALRSFFAKVNLEVSRLETPPALPEGASKHCPRCLATYGDKAETCNDCGGMPLVKQEAEPEAAAAV